MNKIIYLLLGIILCNVFIYVLVLRLLSGFSPLDQTIGYYTYYLDTTNLNFQKDEGVVPRLLLSNHDQKTIVLDLHQVYEYSLNLFWNNFIVSSGGLTPLQDCAFLAITLVFENDAQNETIKSNNKDQSLQVRNISCTNTLPTERNIVRLYEPN